MKKLFLLAVGLSLLTFRAHAQQGDAPAIQFDNTHFNFGQIKEDDGPAVHVYKFTNSGTKKLILTRVQPACGCTASEWSKDSIAPGKDGFVKAIFDPVHRPGAFNKSITVYSNAVPNVTLLTFSGEVIPHVKNLQDSFPIVLGNLRLEQNTINFGSLTNDIKDTTQDLFVYNSSNTPIVIKAIKNDPAPYITIKSLPVVIPPKKSMKVPIHYNPSLNKEFGLDFGQMKLITNDSKDSAKTISVIADMHPYVKKPVTDAEKAKAPVAFYPVKEHDFGDVKEGDPAITNFKVSNKGKSELVILKVKTSCGCTVSEPEKKVLKPGETTNIKVTFNSAGKHGKEQKTITVYTNDPFNTESTLKIYANVVAPEEGK